MTPGQIARRVLGRHFPKVGRLYRAIFVDVDRVADQITRLLPPQANCLDIGGGDGMIAGRLLAQRSDIAITMIDLAPAIGGFIDPAHRSRVTLRPATSLGELQESASFDAMIMTDVLHHIPEHVRAEFFRQLYDRAVGFNCRLLIIKDIEPGSPISALSVLSDKYITGDRSVSLISISSLRTLLEACLPTGTVASFRPSFVGGPNYCVAVDLSF